MTTPPAPVVLDLRNPRTAAPGVLPSPESRVSPTFIGEVGKHWVQADLWMGRRSSAPAHLTVQIIAPGRRKAAITADVENSHGPTRATANLLGGAAAYAVSPRPSHLDLDDADDRATERLDALIDEIASLASCPAPQRPALDEMLWRLRCVALGVTPEDTLVWRAEYPEMRVAEIARFLKHGYTPEIAAALFTRRANWWTASGAASDLAAFTAWSPRDIRALITALDLTAGMETPDPEWATFPAMVAVPAARAGLSPSETRTLHEQDAIDFDALRTLAALRA